MSHTSDMTKKLVNRSLSSIKHVFEDDTESSLSKIDSVRQINTSNTLQYIKKEEELKHVATKIERISDTNGAISESLRSIDDLESKVDLLGKVTSELDEYSKELEVKINTRFVK